MKRVYLLLHPLKKNHHLLKKKKKKKNKKERDLFVLDNNPSVDENNGLCTKYCTKFQIDRSEKSTEDESEIKISAQTCFNCDNNHAIKDCPLPKNFAKINAARQRFKAQKQTSRYHLEEDQKYGHLIPGIISNNLREALGLRKNQLPPFIYHMRTLGYPPGWLEEAKFLHSNLEMFDTEGNNVRALTKKKQGLDPDKIINYPGFNVPVPKDVKDENRQYRVPPFSEKFSKQAMIDFFEKQYTKDQDDFETCDMDLDASFEENKEKNDIKIVVEKVMIVNPVLSELKDIDSNLPSPSLIDLEKEKENLLAALEDNTSCNPKSVEIAGEEPEKSDCEVISDIEKSQITEVSLDENLLIDIEKAKDSSTSLSSPPISSGLNTVKNSSFGTPILKSNSPYSRLPNPDNFMKDVSPVINFENLPNSTGKYEQMTEVLQKVRSTLRKNLQNCKS
ncbi:hypothetical protein NQ318_008148 [Aromia moschata]|uniref:PSP proline-rich domain-containing protein n=1 Tax=Aromia moschata TaxID=1265417 RepID=A0AAV8YNF3_9CUCU|nr:hypothetical protein NQ318_008148 [Aromia moschata]